MGKGCFGLSRYTHWVARHLPLPRLARQMLDIGGSHGYFSVAICRRYTQLRATILELPDAIKHAAPLLAREGMGERVAHRAGSAFTDDRGTGGLRPGVHGLPSSITLTR